MRVVIMHFVEFAAFTSKKIQDRIRCHQDTLKYCHAVPRERTKIYENM